MGSEWRARETAALIGTGALLLAAAFYVSGSAGLLVGSIGVVLLVVWVVGAMGKLGLSAFR